MSVLWCMLTMVVCLMYAMCCGRCFVDAVGSLEEVEHKLERYSYDTKTRGHREIQPARLCGEARYELIKHGEDSKVQTHLVYELEVPEQPGEVAGGVRHCQGRTIPHQWSAPAPHHSALRSLLCFSYRPAH